MFIRTKKTFLHHSPPQPRELHELRKLMKFSPRKVKKNASITGWPVATYKEKHLTEKKKLAVTPKIWDNYTMIKKGTQIRVGFRWLIVDEIDQDTGLLWCMDQDGEDFEIRESQIDDVLDSDLPDNPFDQFSWR